MKRECALYRYLLIPLLTLLGIVTASANDGSYYVSGGTLVPVHETDISIAKEVLTITIGNDQYATVDVYYEFFNPNAAKTITMAFEASSPSDTLTGFNRNGVHPFISDFTVTMNGVSIPYDNAVVASNSELKRSEDSTPAYAYFFTAPFKNGKNTVHHTYNFHMYDDTYFGTTVSYWLTPALRWAGGRIGDFTLRIKAESPGTEICMEDSLFMKKPWKTGPGQFAVSTVNHNCKNAMLDFDAMQFEYYGEEHRLFARLHPDNAIEWHTKDFVPDRNIDIWAGTFERPNIFNFSMGQVVVDDSDGSAYIYLGEDDNRYLVAAAQDFDWIDKSSAHVEAYNEETKEHEYVDLGLSVMWATCNVGAKKPEEYGDYYAWGEIYTKDNYVLDRYYKRAPLDVAWMKWGSNWRMPSKQEFQELLDKCKWDMTERNGVSGFQITGPSGNSIFLPTAGMKLDTRLLYSGSSAYYWTGNVAPDNPRVSSPLAWNLCNTSEGIHLVTLAREVGRSVRPVCSPGPTVPVRGIRLRQNECTMAVGSKSNFKPAVYPVNATSVDISWSTSNTDIATVDSNGTVTALSAGEFILTATCGAFKAERKVSVADQSEWHR